MISCIKGDEYKEYLESQYIKSGLKRDYIFRMQERVIMGVHQFGTQEMFDNLNESMDRCATRLMGQAEKRAFAYEY